MCQRRRRGLTCTPSIGRCAKRKAWPDIYYSLFIGRCATGEAWPDIMLAGEGGKPCDERAYERNKTTGKEGIQSSVREHSSVLTLYVQLVRTVLNYVGTVFRMLSLTRNLQLEEGVFNSLI